MSITPDLLDALLSPQNNIRQAAEAYLQTIPDCCTALLQAHTHHHKPSHAHLVSVLLRREILKTTDRKLLESMIPVLLERHMGPCVAEACGVLESSQTPNAETTVMPILQHVLQHVAHESLQGDDYALKLLIALAEKAPRAFCSCAVSSLPHLVATALAHAPNKARVVTLLTELVVQTSLATTCTTSVAPWRRWQTTTQQEIDVHSPAAQLGESCLLVLLPHLSSSPAALEHLVYASETIPSLFCQPRVLEMTLRTCLDMAADKKDFMLCLQALDVVTQLTSVGRLRRAVLQESTRQAIVQTSTPLLLHIMADSMDYDHVQDWALEQATMYHNDDNDEGDELAAYATDVLESLVHSLSNHAMPLVLQQVEGLLSSSGSNDWRRTRAALAALQSCLEAAPMSFAPHVHVATEAALCYSESPHVRVQYQSICLLGALCEAGTNMSDDKQEFATRVLQALSRAAQSRCSKISVAGSGGIVAYCRPSGQTVVDAERLVVPYVSDVLSALVSGPLSGDSVVVKVRAMGAVACLAEVAQEAFVPFYAHVMPGLLACANTPAHNNHYELSCLKGAAIEAATIVGQSIGAENIQLFARDAESIMELAVSILSMSSDGDVVAGMPMDQLLSGCARIASVMKDLYAPFLKSVFPHLLLRATDTSGDIEISDCVDAEAESTVQYDEETGTENMTVALPGRGLTKVTINTSKIQEKAQASRAIYEHAYNLGAAFGPYAKTSLDSFLVLLGFKYSAEIRSTASQTLSAVFEAACSYGEEVGMDVPATYFPVVAKSLAQQIVDEDDSDMEVLFALAESISQVFYSVYCRLSDHGANLLQNFNNDDAKFVVKLCMKALVACLERRAKITSILSGSTGSLSEDESEEYGLMLKKEEELLSPLVDTVGYTLKFHREEFLPTFQSDVVPVLGPYLKSGNDLSARFAAVCLFDDCIEFCGAAAAATFAPQLIEGAVAGLDDATNGNNMELKRASIYGIAQVSRYAPSNVLLPHAQRIMPNILAVVSKSKDEFEEAPGVFENAISALGSLTLFGSAPFKGFVKEDVAVSVLLANMPLREDCDESKICSSGLCELVDRGAVRLDSECDNILRIIGETLALVNDDEELAAPETIVRFAGILFRLQQEVNGDLMNSAFSKLTPEAQGAVNGSMQQYGHLYSNVVTPEK